MKIVKQFQPKIVIFTAVKNRSMLHGRVFVMVRSSNSSSLFKFNYTSNVGQLRQPILLTMNKT